MLRLLLLARLLGLFLGLALRFLISLIELLLLGIHLTIASVWLGAVCAVLRSTVAGTLRLPHQTLHKATQSAGSLPLTARSLPLEGACSIRLTRLALRALETA